MFPIPVVGAPKTLFTLKVDPVLKRISCFSSFLVVLGFGTSRYVVLIVSTSYPFTKALPGEISYRVRSSDANYPPCVNLPSAYTPLLPTPSSNDSLTDTLNGATV